MSGSDTLPSSQPTKGHVTLLLGCMFSGKTTSLLRRLSESPPDRTLAFKHSCDTRFTKTAIVSHGGLSCNAICIDRPSEILRFVRTDVALVAVDEAHFFDRSIAQVVGSLKNHGINVVLASLEPDSWGVPFPVNQALRELADTVNVLRAACARCGRPADRTQRLTPIVNGQMIVDPSNYEPRCQACWHPPKEPHPGFAESSSVFPLHACPAT